MYDEQPRATAVPTGQELDAVKKFGKDYGAIAKTLAIDENRARVLYAKVARYLGELALSRR